MEDEQGQDYQTEQLNLPVEKNHRDKLVEPGWSGKNGLFWWEGPD